MLPVVNRYIGVEEVLGTDGNIHIGGGQIKAGHEGTEGIDVDVSPFSLHYCREVLDQVSANALLEVTRADIFVEIDDLLV